MNAFLPIDVTDAGMVIDVKLAQFWNAKIPIDVTKAGMPIDVKVLQAENALAPMVLSCEPDEGMMTDAKRPEPSNA